MNAASTVPTSRSMLGLMTAGWLLAIGFCFAGLWAYHFTPGSPGSVGQAWPSDTTIPRRDNGYTLVMFAHPRCPCVAVSLEALEELLSHHADRLHAHILFIVPSESEEPWKQSPYWRQAEQIAGVRVASDFDRTEARRFAAHTSGHTLLFDRAGRLVFSGGISAARGQRGGGGFDAICQVLHGGSTETITTDVFGCPLFESESLVTRIEVGR